MFCCVGATYSLVPYAAHKCFGNENFGVAYGSIMLSVVSFLTGAFMGANIIFSVYLGHHNRTQFTIFVGCCRIPHHVHHRGDNNVCIPAVDHLFAPYCLRFTNFLKMLSFFMEIIINYIRMNSFSILWPMETGPIHSESLLREWFFASSSSPSRMACACVPSCCAQTNAMARTLLTRAH